MANLGIVRYRRNNTLLRHVLWQQWGSRCYWCNKLKDFTDTQIDHIIPKRSRAELEVLLKAFGLCDPMSVTCLP